MRPFVYERAADISGAIQAASSRRSHEEASFLAGGTTLIDLMKLDVMRPQRVIDINGLARSPVGQIMISDDKIHLGAMVHMSEAADHAVIRHDYPVIAQSLELAASAQLRNMATLGGNVLQRTRCSYFRDVSYPNCNKRAPGSGCAALEGFNRQHAVLGTSEACIASYPGDFAQALIALDAQVELTGPQGPRTVPFDRLHRRPENSPEGETTLKAGELITAFMIQRRPWMRRSVYLKIRDRQSYEFALASAAVALDLDGNRVRDVRIALGGVATVPWRARDAENTLAGRVLDEAATYEAAERAFEGAQPREHNAFKVALGKRTLIRALHQAAKMDIRA
jgi:xanthine dehydrogenase YagS FAD-binding subunit